MNDGWRACASCEASFRHDDRCRHVGGAPVVGSWSAAAGSAERSNAGGCAAEANGSAGGRSTGRRPFWPVLLLGACCALVLLAVAGMRLNGMMKALQSTTVPTSTLSAEVFGGGDPARVDARPALLAAGSGVPPSPRADGGRWQASFGAVGERPLSILLLGVDARAGEAIDLGVRPDAIAVLRLDPRDGSCRLLSVPRDTRAELPGYGSSKVNHALAVGGVPYQRQVMEQLLGLPIDRFVLIDFTAVEEIVEALGGVTLDVPEAFVAANGMRFEAGRQRLDGRQVLAYAQFRGDSDGDLGRINRQQQVARSVLDAASGFDVVAEMPTLLPVLEAHMRTDLGLVEMVALARTFGPTCTADSVQLASLDGESASFQDPLVGQPLWYVIVPEAEIARLRAWLEGGVGKPGE